MEVEQQKHKTWDEFLIQEKCKFYHDITYNIQDKTFEKFNFRKISEQIIPTGNVFQFSYTKKLQATKNSHKISLDEEHVDITKQYGLTNVRVKTSEETLVSLEIGGQRFGRVGYHPYYKDKDGYFVFTLFEKNIIPLFHEKVHSICLHVSNTKPCEITYMFDYVEINSLSNNNAFEIMYNDQQFSGKEKVKGGDDENKIQIDFNHPMKGLDVISTKNLIKVSFVYNDLTNQPIHIPFTQEKDGYFVYHIDFHPTINFSQIDYANLRIKAVQDADVYVFGKSMGLLRSICCMYGAAFTK